MRERSGGENPDASQAVRSAKSELAGYRPGVAVMPLLPSRPLFSVDRMSPILPRTSEGWPSFVWHTGAA
jgi:hypothetical protein